MAAVLVDRLDHPRRVLAARRSTPAELSGRWEFPGGKVDDGEDPAAALQRELREELGVEVVLGAELVAPDARPWPISPAYEMRTWWARVRSGEPAPRGSHDELRWVGVGVAELAQLDWLDADLAVVRRVSLVLSAHT